MRLPLGVLPRLGFDLPALADSAPNRNPSRALAAADAQPVDPLLVVCYLIERKLGDFRLHVIHQCVENVCEN